VSTVKYGVFLLPQKKILLFERSKKKIGFFKKICGIFFSKKDTSDFLEKYEVSFFEPFK